MSELDKIEVDEWDEKTKMVAITDDVQMYAGDRGTEVQVSVKLTKDEMMAFIMRLTKTLEQY